eukprot:CAMPEP_0202474816 /NCGR_PEP_ID=MMETSP1360-20130828/92572_1 /ASSEMBLY_ACC=CAM_ASM_000848 /TAXON_ID=515479 /ORGANISM="Licmophora paradoxa, Strain CCMP2313" /LENGTH=118 /DNA_ID=CAMNT_0049101957 /DNA_START=739 /DNA_END=1095 /DNA_ORIENTATION=-
MCNEWDETHIAMKGADQGFHNYLFYSNKLANAKEIRGIKVFEQGRGIINNLGALRDFNLRDIGAYDPKDGLVYNWDRTISPVVHQWDRDKELFHFTMETTFKQMKKDWIVAQQNETKS